MWGYDGGVVGKIISLEENAKEGTRRKEELKGHIYYSFLLFW